MSVDILTGALDPVPAAAADAFTVAPRMPDTPRREFDTAEGATNAEARGTVPAAARRPTAAAAALEVTILAFPAVDSRREMGGVVPGPVRPKKLDGVSQQPKGRFDAAGTQGAGKGEVQGYCTYVRSGVGLCLDQFGQKFWRGFHNM